MITQKQIETLRDLEGLDWIGALRPEANSHAGRDRGRGSWACSTSGTSSS